MGMVWSARLANNEDLVRLRADPSIVRSFVEPENELQFLEARPDSLYFDKEWHLIHFLLSGSAGLTGSKRDIVLGDFEPIGEDNGYGPPWIIPTLALRDFVGLIASLSKEELQASFDPQAMRDQQVYLADAFGEEPEDSFEGLIQRLGDLAVFARKGAMEGRHAIAMLS